MEERGGWKSVVSTIAILVAAPVIAIILVAFVFQSYQVDGPSMETTLQDNDRLIVLKLPSTWARITRKPYVPKRGDIVIFHQNQGLDAFAEQGKQLVKRVIALPGERVVVKDGQVIVYNKEHPEGFQPDKTLPYGKVIVTTPGNIDMTIPEGEVFVCGDNRTNSLDSRSFGPVPAKDIVGKLALRIFPLSKAKSF